jgi:hypothetical protein
MSRYSRSLDTPLTKHCIEFSAIGNVKLNRAYFEHVNCVELTVDPFEAAGFHNTYVKLNESFLFCNLHIIWRQR